MLIKMTCIYEEFLMMLEIISCGMKQSMSFRKNEKEIDICALYFNYINVYLKISMLSERGSCVFVLLLMFVIQTLGAYFL